MRSPRELDDLLQTGRVQFALTIPGISPAAWCRSDKAQISSGPTPPIASARGRRGVAALPQALIDHRPTAGARRLAPFRGRAPALLIPKPSPPQHRAGPLGHHPLRDPGHD